MNGLLDWQDVALVYPFSAAAVLDGSRLVWSGRSRFGRTTHSASLSPAMANRPSRLLILILAPTLGFGLLLGWLSTELPRVGSNKPNSNSRKAVGSGQTNIQPFLDPVDPISLQVVLDEYARSLPDATISLIDIDGRVIVSAGDVPNYHQALSIGLINKGEMAGQLVSQLRIEHADAARSAIWGGTLITLMVIAALLTGLVVFFGDFVMLWLGFLRGRLAAPSPNHHCHLTQNSR